MKDDIENLLSFLDFVFQSWFPVGWSREKCPQGKGCPMSKDRIQNTGANSGSKTFLTGPISFNVDPDPV